MRRSLVAAALVAAVALVSVLATLAVAGRSLTQRTGSLVLDVKIKSQSATKSTLSKEWRNVPGSKIEVEVPRGQFSILLARFSGTSDCPVDFGGVANCHVRLMVGGKQMHPRGVTIFDSTNAQSGDDLQEAHTIERSIGPLKPGTYVLRAQWRTTDEAHPFVLRGWHLTLERIRVD